MTREELKQNAKLYPSLKFALVSLRDRAESLGGPEAHELHLAFTDADDYPDFDIDPEANYVSGILQGAADAMGISTLTLLDWLEEEDAPTA